MAVVFAAFWLCPARFRYLVLLLASYVFYAFAGPEYLLILLYITTAAYFLARPGGGRMGMFFSVLIMLLPLLYFKYTRFLAENINGVYRIFDEEGMLRFEGIILPLGISFYTFSALAYVIDVKRRKTQRENSFLHLASGIAFFPCLISGPIERQPELLGQIKNSRAFDYDTATAGLKLMAWGYFKKLVIANTMSLTTDEVFSNLHSYTGWPLALAVFMFSIQIYCDFSGYTDIATGCAALFGIRLVKNFDMPYLARSIKEFWGRWHISLSTWFRDYVYIPLGGNRKGTIRRDLNLLITFVVSGLWHGAGWNFVLWGTIHALGQILENHFPLFLRKDGGRLFSVFRVILIFLFVTAAWVFFKTDTLEDAFYVFGNMFAAAPVLDPANNVDALLDALNMGSISDLFTIGVSLAALFSYDFSSLAGDVWGRVKSMKKPVRWIIYISLGVFTLLLKPEEAAGQFIYFKF